MEKRVFVEAGGASVYRFNKKNLLKKIEKNTEYNPMRFLKLDVDNLDCF